MNWLRAYLFFPLKLLGTLMQIFVTNRAWIDERLARKNVAFYLKGFAVSTLLIWIAIWLYTFSGPVEQINKTRPECSTIDKIIQLCR